MGGKQSKQTNSTNTPTVSAENDTKHNTASPEYTNPALDTLLKGQLSMGTLFNQTIAADVIAKISDYAPEMATANRHFAASSKILGADQIRNKTILTRLLQAVVYGMESKEANAPVKASDAANLFKSNLFAKDLLQKSPEFLIARGDVTDWAGRTFKNITAFEYALWAKDFKMIEMMLLCIPDTENGNEIREMLLQQYKQVTAPTFAGGGLTYTHTYERPNLDASGIPDGTTTSVTEVHTDNHFDITTLCAAYRDYQTDERHNLFNNPMTWHTQSNCWLKLIGTLNRLLPVHVLQRYCDHNTPFYPIEKDKTFHGVFRRSTYCPATYNNIHEYWISRSYQTDSYSSIFCTSISSDFALTRFAEWRKMLDMHIKMEEAEHGHWMGHDLIDLAAVRHLDKVSTKEIEKIISQLLQPQHASVPRF